jgi:putative membrane protein
LGYGVEVAGVHTGMVFGEYSYGKTLGFKIADVPLVMGLNWLTLIYSAGVIFNRLNAPVIVKSALGGLVLMILDLFIEPIAIRYDYWSWESISVPLQNYLAWFVISFLFLMVFFSLKFKKENKLALLYLSVQFFFFVGLNYFK